MLDIYVERVTRPEPDEARIAAAIAPAATCLAALDGLLGGPELTLADLHAAPMVAYFVLAPEGRAMLARHPRLASWWERIAARPSLRDTASRARPAECRSCCPTRRRWSPATAGPRCSPRMASC